MKQPVCLILSILLLLSVLCGCATSETDSTQETKRVVPAFAPATPDVTNAETVPTETTAPVDASWFDDAVFIGDSITVTLDYFCANDSEMVSDAKFVCADSLSYHNALWDLSDDSAVHPTYRGETILAETAAEVTGAKKVFILLGVNDIGTYGPEDTLESAKELTKRILTHSPDVAIYFQSTTPMVKKQESGWLNNMKIRKFNELLKSFCEENDYHYLDLYSQVCDQNQNLKESYCEDVDYQGIHFNGDGCTVWTDFLKSAVD